jgi:hypothetical protein
MAIVKQNIPTHLHNAQKVNSFRLWELGKSQIQRSLWHFRAYTTVFTILFFSLISLIFLLIHWTYRKFFSTHSIIETNKWDLNSSN